VLPRTYLCREGAPLELRKNPAKNKKGILREKRGFFMVEKRIQGLEGKEKIPRKSSRKITQLETQHKPGRRKERGEGLRREGESPGIFKEETRE